MGRIRSKDRAVKKYCGLHSRIVTQRYKGRILNATKTKGGYLSVHLGVNKKKFNFLVHYLILKTFISERPEGYECCHNNGNPADNRLQNLRWDTHFNNNQDRKKHGNYPSGEKHPNYGKKMPDDLKARLLSIHQGRKASKETKEKMSLAQKERWEKIRVQK